MARTVPPGILASITQSDVQPFYAAEILLDSGALRLWTGVGTRTIDGETYIGGGDFVSVSGLEEVADLSAKNITLELSGMPSSVIQTALVEPYQRRKARVLWGTIDNPTEYVELFSGSLNQMVISDSAETGTVTVSVDSKLVELEKASNWRYTSESHKARHPGDTFFDFVAAIQDKKITFERK